MTDLTKALADALRSVLPHVDRGWDDCRADAERADEALAAVDAQQAALRELECPPDPETVDRAVNQQLTTDQLREAFEAFVRTGPGFRPSMLYRRDMAGSERFGEYCDRGIEWQWRALQAGYALRPVQGTERTCEPFSDPSAMVATRSADRPGVTVYDLGPSRNPDSAISRKLIEMGWTPPPARCDCGKKLASECEPWEPDCDLGKSAEHARAVRLPQQAEASVQPAVVPVGEREALSNIIAAYDAYRRRGVAPAPGEYAQLVEAIDKARAAITQQPEAVKPLTDEQIKKMYALNHWHDMTHFTWGAAEQVARAIERAHGIGAGQQENKG